MLLSTYVPYAKSQKYELCIAAGPQMSRGYSSLSGARKKKKRVPSSALAAQRYKVDVHDLHINKIYLCFGFI